MNTAFDLSPNLFPRNVTQSWIERVLESLHKYATTLQVCWRTKGIAFLELEPKSKQPKPLKEGRDAE